LAEAAWPLRANTDDATIMIAEKASDMIRAGGLH
jgi:hypothetical protein